MIDLTPIDERIQKRLFQKMDLLGKKVPNQSSDSFTFQQLANKTTFIRMTSGLERPVILMGGELLPTGEATDSEGIPTLGSSGEFSRVANGYDDIYGPRPYYSETDIFQENELGSNKFKRPKFQRWCKSTQRGNNILDLLEL